MAATYTATKLSPNPDDTVGKNKYRYRTVTFAGTYTTGGDAVTPALFGLSQLVLVEPIGTATDGTLAYDATYIQSSKKIKLWETGTGGAGSAEKGNGESLTGITLVCRAIGY